MADYPYDAFLSYSSLDRQWAEQLEKELLARQYKIFRDKSRLTAGNDWNKELQQAIGDSRHLIVLWSNNAAQSQWVTQEMTELQRPLQTCRV